MHKQFYLSEYRGILCFLFLMLLLPETGFSFSEKKIDSDSSCLCEFGIQYFSVRYEGPSGALVKVYASKDQQDFVQEFENVNSGDELFIDKSDFMKGSVKTKTFLAVAGDTSTEVSFHTSCSEYILGQTKGYFTVTAFQDAFGHVCALPLSAAADVVPVACFGEANGAVIIHATGGFQPYTYLWADGETIASREGLPAGNYEVTITDFIGETVELSVEIDAPEPLTVRESIKPISCAGEMDGAISLNVSGGVAPYQYKWSDGTTDPAVTQLPPGIYAVEVTDRNGCVAADSFEITAPDPLEANIVSDACGRGELSAVVTGGTGLYRYSWSTGAETAAIVAEESGSYFVTVTDAGSCITSDTLVVDTLSFLDITTELTSPVCHGDSTGSIAIAVTGSDGPFTYLWSTGDTTQNLSGMPAGTYQVTVTDAKGADCARTFDITLAQPSAAAIEATLQPISCAGEADGRIAIDTISGNGPFEIVWSTGDTTTVLSGLEAGAYTVTVTNREGCTVTRAFEISAPEPLQARFRTNCDQSSIRVIPTGGTRPYQYNWNGSSRSGSSTFEPDSAGTYFVTVTDYNGCQVTDSITIDTLYASLVIKGEVTQATCQLPGSIAATAEGGKPPYRYAWSNGDTTTTLAGLLPGTYSLTVIDENDCTSSATFSINPLPELEVTVAKTDESCEGGDGSVMLTVSGGESPYRYSWNTGDTTAAMEGMVAGDYTVTVEDAAGCSTIESVTLVASDSCGIEGEEPSEEVPGEVDECCDGKVTWLTLKYLGAESAGIEVFQKKDNQRVFSGLVAPNDTFTFYGNDKKGTLSTEVLVYVDGQKNTQIHTSCSQPIGPGLISGDFEVIAGESRNGGALCPVDAEQPSSKLAYDVYPNPSDGKMVVHFVSKTEAEVLVRIYDFNGKLRGSASFSGAESDYDVGHLTGALPAGLYLMMVDDGVNRVSKKIVIQ